MSEIAADNRQYPEMEVLKMSGVSEAKTVADAESIVEFYGGILEDSEMEEPDNIETLEVPSENELQIRKRLWEQ